MRESIEKNERNERKAASWYDVYKGIRKPIARPGYVEDDKRPSGPYEEELDVIDELEDRAAKNCENGKGHLLGHWQRFEETMRTISENKCVRCNKGVTVIDRPTKEESQISGEAFMSECDKKRR